MPKTAWAFASFSFGRARGLEQNGVAIPLQAKPRGLLELLLRAEGGIVAKDTIAAALWGADTPTDASIARAVSALRRALGSEGEIVRTIYGVGVQITCPIVATQSGTEHEQEVLAQLLRTAWEVAESRLPQGYNRALATLNYAVQRFPDAALAWALLANAHASRAIRSLTSPSRAAASIHDCCEKALLADPSCAEALAVSGLALGIFQGQSAVGLARLDKALQSTTDWPAFVYRAWIEIDRHNLTAAMADVERGLALTPFSRSLLEMKAFILLYQGRLETADRFARDRQTVRDDADGLWIVRSIVASERGDLAGGCLHAERAAHLMENSAQAASYLAYAYAKAGKTDRARTLIAGIERGLKGHMPALLAAPYLALGDREKARAVLAAAKAEHCPHAAAAWCDPRLAALAG